jgi:aspartate/methionine/tyrosine aminotransferase
MGPQHPECPERLTAIDDQLIMSGLAPHIARLVTNSNSCTAAMVQWAGVEALNGDQTAPARMVEAFLGRRDVIVEGLNAIPGMRCIKPHLILPGKM